MTYVAQKNTRSYKIRPDAWPPFEVFAEVLASNIRGVHKGDVLAVAMEWFQNLAPEKQREMINEFRDREVPEFHITDGMTPRQALAVLENAGWQTASETTATESEAQKASRLDAKAAEVVEDAEAGEAGEAAALKRKRKPRRDRPA